MGRRPYLSAALFFAAVLGLAAAFLAGAFFAAALAGAGAASAPLSVAGAFAVLGAAFAGRGSNSKPVLPSGWRTKKAENLRLVRLETKPFSRSVLPSFRSLLIWARSISCCRMILPERKSQLFAAPTDFSQT